MRSDQNTILDAIKKSPPRIITDVGAAANGQGNALSPKGGAKGAISPNQAGAKKPGAPVVGPNGAVQRPEDNKDSPEYKKKQAMTAGPVLNMDYENYDSYGMNTSLFSSLKDIFEAIIAHQSRTGVVSPNKFLEILRRENEMFRTAMHQDAHEFLNLLLNEVVENVEQFAKIASTNGHDNSALASTMASAITAAIPGVLASHHGANNTRWVHELFEGTLTSETRCLTCENTSQRDEAFLDLSVDLEQHSSVTSCLRKFSEEEMLCERNKFHCDRCGGLQEAEKRMKVKRLPKILALHLKRFKYTEDLRRLQKLFHRVVYPYYLRLFNTTDDAEDPDRLYELYAVVVHIGGGPYHGHYVSIIKTQDRGWLLFDDEMVEPVDKSYVRNFFGGENALACAYVLFYQETTFEAMQKEQEAEGLAAAKASAQADAAANGTTPAGVKANGFHHPTSPTTPMTEDLDHFANLDHAVTAPAVGSPHHPHPPPVVVHSHANPAEHPLEHVATSPFLPSGNTAVGGAPVTLTLSKAERKAHEKAQKALEKQQEKERKASEKEQEKLLLQKRKEQEKRRLEAYRKQEEDYWTAIQASKQTAADEAKKQSQENGSKEGGGGGISGLSRFRQSSMSLRHKPKLFGGKEKDDGEASQDSTPEKDKGKNRFSIGRKKSTLGL